MCVGETPLHDAARSGDAELVQVLLDGGADSKATDANGERPVDWARKAGFASIVEMLE
jgi:ankyrin repeat protein